MLRCLLVARESDLGRLVKVVSGLLIDSIIVIKILRTLHFLTSILFLLVNIDQVSWDATLISLLVPLSRRHVFLPRLGS